MDVSKIKKDGEVMVTHNYNMFRRVIGNRVIDDRHVQQLVESMKKADLKIPIIINAKNEVIDGQHRLQARKLLHLPVFYIVLKDMGIKETQEANINNRNWNADDFLNTFCELKYAHYLKYREFMNKYELSHSAAMALLGGYTGGGNASKDFREGKFVISNYEQSVKWVEQLLQIERYYKGFKRRGFVTAMMHLFKNEKYNHEEFMKKLAYQSSKLVDCADMRQYIKIIEEIYNDHKKVENKVIFI